MELNIRPLLEEEQKYTYEQSPQIRGETCSIGRLRGDFDSTGTGFFTTWNDYSKALKTEDFMNEFDDVINALRTKDCGLLDNLTGMKSYVHMLPKSKMKGSYTTEYGFRIDTEKYSYLLRCNPTKGDYNFYVYCYLKDILNDHIKEAQKGIRFIDGKYNTLFKLEDGGKIAITDSKGQKSMRTCRFVDKTHTEIDGIVFHICEYAEKMEEKGNHYGPYIERNDTQKTKEYER